MPLASKLHQATNQRPHLVALVSIVHSKEPRHISDPTYSPPPEHSAKATQGNLQPPAPGVETWRVPFLDIVPGSVNGKRDVRDGQDGVRLRPRHENDPKTVKSTPFFSLHDICDTFSFLLLCFFVGFCRFCHFPISDPGFHLA